MGEYTFISSATVSAVLPGAGVLAGVMRLTVAGTNVSDVRGSRLAPDTPETAAGMRVVHLPPHLIPDLQRPLDTFVPADCLYVFPNSKGAPLRRGSFASVWQRARVRAGVPHLRFHDLRHTGNRLAAATGASTRELMSRMACSSMRAALIYQHATTDRGAAIAAALSRLAARGASGTRCVDPLARRPSGRRRVRPCPTGIRSGT